MSDTLGWIATAIMVLASIDIAHRNIRGLWLMALGNMFWLVVGYLSGLYSLIAVSVIMTGLDFYGIYKWRKDHRQNELRRLCDKYEVFCPTTMENILMKVPTSHLEFEVLQMRKDTEQFAGLYKANINEDN